MKLGRKTLLKRKQEKKKNVTRNERKMNLGKKKK